jgi:hypothetical protein
MKKKILVVGITLLSLVMLVTPVLAGPLKVPVGKNKNINEGMPPSETTVYLWTNPGGSFKEFYYNSETGLKWTLMRRNASQCSIGGAVDGSDWDYSTGPIAFVRLLQADSRWVYFDQDGMYNILVAFGFPPVFAGIVSSQFPEGVYFKADIIKLPD